MDWKLTTKWSGQLVFCRRTGRRLALQRKSGKVYMFLFSLVFLCISKYYWIAGAIRYKLHPNLQVHDSIIHGIPWLLISPNTTFSIFDVSEFWSIFSIKKCHNKTMWKPLVFLAKMPNTCDPNPPKAHLQWHRSSHRRLAAGEGPQHRTSLFRQVFVAPGPDAQKKKRNIKLVVQKMFAILVFFDIFRTKWK